MVVCRNWDGRPGSCKFGDRCRFEHPQSDRGNSSTNPFAPLQRDNSNTRTSNGFQAGASTQRALPFQLDKNQITIDLYNERPQWILSAYGPGRNAPEQLFGGPMREQSFEEMRVLHVLGMRSGNPQQAAQNADKLVQAAEQQIQTALNNVDGAIDFLIHSEKNHPNRIDIVRDSNAGAPQNTNAFAQGNNPNPFQTAKPTNNAFGGPSQPATTSAFGAPSIGATNGAFGQPSALGAKPNPFGAPSQSAFGTPAIEAPSQPGGGGAFGQPSALGQRPNPFGAPSDGSSTNGGFSTFAGTGGAFGQPSQPAASNAFGAPSQPATVNPFGAPSRPAPANPFGGTSSAPFGAPPQALKNLFGAPSSQPAAQNPFGPSSSAPQNPFGAPTSQVPAASPFGGTSAPKPEPFGLGPTPTAANPFGNQQNAPAAANPFGATSNGPKPANSTPFGDTPQPNAPPYQPVANGSTTQHPPLNSYATVGGDGRLTMFKGRRVVYKDGEPGFERRDRSWEKIWFPQGAPALNGDTEMEDAAYDDQAKAAYMHVRQTGTFQGDVMPMLPPKRDWCLWDF